MNWKCFFSVLRKKPAKWILFFLVLGLCIFLLLPGLSWVETDIFIPVAPVNMPDGKTLSVPFPKGIEATVKGPRTAIEKIMEHPPQYTLDLSGIDTGVKSVPVDTSLIPLPKDVMVSAVNPLFLSIAVEKEIIKNIPVSVSLHNQPAAGYFVSNVVAAPSSVILRGPKSLLQPIEKIHTKPVDMDSVMETFRKETALDLPKGIENADPKKIVLVEVVIREKIDTLVFDDFPVTGVNSRHAYHISPASMRIKIKGPVNVLNHLDPEKDITVHIDLKELEPGVHLKPAIISLPVGISLVQAAPEVFTVKVATK